MREKKYEMRQIISTQFAQLIIKQIVRKFASGIKKP